MRAGLLGRWKSGHRTLLSIAGAGALALAGTAPALAQDPPTARDPSDPNGDRRAHELNAEVAARNQAAIEANARAQAEYQAAMVKYEADMAAHRAHMARIEACNAGDRTACEPN